MEEAKDKGVVYQWGVNFDGSRGLGYAYWDGEDWIDPKYKNTAPLFTPKAWLTFDSIMPKF
ncbi:MAG: hypothetical protein K6G00_00345 [Treponema sp.]|nr:hypothetical protein [Treponema sp.]